MRFSLGALGRSSGIRRSRGRSPESARGAYVAVADLVALEAAARDFTLLPRQPVHSLLSGRHGSRVRGRGLAFEELRQYLPGDDIRTMDWRVTARTGSPFVRVYTEEKDRPALFVVDQRISMFFAGRGSGTGPARSVAWARAEPAPGGATGRLDAEARTAAPGATSGPGRRRVARSRATRPNQ